MTIKIGITGGIGSGKSVVSRMLGIMGIPVYVSDAESKRLTASDPVIRKKLCELLGAEVYRDGELDKSVLASYLFSDPAHAQQVNGIIHPQVREDFHRWVSGHPGSDIVGIESAILIEAGFTGDVDVVVMVYAPLEIRISRAIERDGASRELVLRRIQAQMDDRVKSRQASFVIVNDGITPLLPQILKLVKALRRRIDS